MSLILALDTALGETHLGIFRGTNPLAEYHQQDYRLQAKSLLGWIEDCLSDAGITYSDLSGIATSTGPGGFTSIRIGLAAARALAFALRIPIQGFSTLELMAEAHGQHLKNGQTIACALPAGRSQYFFESFNREDNTIIPAEHPIILDEQMFIKKIKNLDLLAAYHPEKMPFNNFSGNLVLHSPLSHPATLANLWVPPAPGTHFAAPTPVYIRPPDAKLPARRT